MYRIKNRRRVNEQRSLNSKMGEPLVSQNKRAYSGHRELPISPDVGHIGTTRTRVAFNDPELRGSWF